MLLIDLLIAAFATTQLVEVLHHGSLFAGLRAWGFANKQATNVLRRKLGELTTCAFCQSHWAGWFAVFGVLFASPLLPAGLALLFRWFVYGLAATRLANLLNDLTHDWSRSPGDPVIPPATEEEDYTYDPNSPSNHGATPKTAFPG